MRGQAHGCTFFFVLTLFATLFQCGRLIFEGDMFDPRVLGMYSRDVGPECRLSVSTDSWTTCLTFLTMYNITLPEMFKMNPLVEGDCFGFKPGSDYCVVARKSTHGFCFGLQFVCTVQAFGVSFLI